MIHSDILLSILVSDCCSLSVCSSVERVAVLVDLSLVTGLTETDFDDTQCSLVLLVLALLFVVVSPV